MASVTGIFSFQRRVYKRQLKASRVRGAERLLAGWIIAILLIRYMFNCFFTLSRIQAGNIFAGMAMTEFNMLHILLVWMVVPFLLSSTAAGSFGLKPERLLHYPFTRFNLFIIWVFGIVIQPVYWILTCATFVSIFPLIYSANPTGGLIAGFLFVIFCSTLCWVMTLLGTSISPRKSVHKIFSIIRYLVLLLLVFVNFDFRFKNNEIYVLAFQKSVLLSGSSSSTGLLSALKHITPASWVVSTSIDRMDGNEWPSFLWIILISAFIVLCFLFSFMAFNRTLKNLHRPEVRRRSGLKSIGSLSLFPHTLGILINKELRSLTRSLELFIGSAISLGLTLYFIIQHSPAFQALYIGVPLILLIEGSVLFNSFGVDGHAAARYRLMPVTGKQIMLSKNIAFYIIAAFQIIPPLTAAFFKVDCLLSLNMLFAAVGIIILYTLWGNISSVLLPASADSGFTNSEQGGGIISQIYAHTIWTIPFYIERWTRSVDCSPGNGCAATVLAMAVFSGLCLTAYWRLIPKMGTFFEDNADDMFCVWGE